MKEKPYTAYTEVNAMLAKLIAEVKVVLQKQFVGMYLYGSLSSGDFDLQSSDIDFAVVTETFLSDELILTLRSMHEGIWKSGSKWAAKLEGSYLPRDLIRRHDLNGRPCPTVNEGRFYLGRLGSDWIIQRHIIREHGVILEGPDPKHLIDPVSADEIRQSVLGVLHEWWFPMLEDPGWLREHGSEYHAYAITSMCRALHALHHGTIVSKPAAIRWAQVELDGECREVIENTVEALASEGKNYELYEGALAMIRFTLDRVEHSH